MKKILLLIAGLICVIGAVVLLMAALGYINVGVTPAGTGGLIERVATPTVYRVY